MSAAHIHIDCAAKDSIKPFIRFYIPMMRKNQNNEKKERNKLDCIIRLIKLRYRRKAEKNYRDVLMGNMHSKDVVIFLHLYHSFIFVVPQDPSLKYHWIPLWINLIKSLFFTEREKERYKHQKHENSISVIYRKCFASLMRTSVWVSLYFVFFFLLIIKIFLILVFIWCFWFQYSGDAFHEFKLEFCRICQLSLEHS